MERVVSKHLTNGRSQREGGGRVGVGFVSPFLVFHFFSLSLFVLINKKSKRRIKDETQSQDLTFSKASDNGMY